jgi:hypothetical protein
VKAGDRLYTEAEMQALREQLETAQARIAQLEQSWHDSASMATYTTKVSDPASEPKDRCERCDSTIGIEQAREIGRENFCTVCWDAPIIRRRSASNQDTREP